jgi:hypothetical protein
MYTEPTEEEEDVKPMPKCQFDKKKIFAFLVEKK